MQSSHDAYDPEFNRCKPESECRELVDIYFKDCLRDPLHLFLVAEGADGIVGMMHVERKTKPPIFSRQRFAMVNEVSVAESFRGQGLYRALLEEAESRLRSEGITQIELLVDVSNPAVNAYVQTGFTSRQFLMVKWI
jgi:ribosomal protein S18 acetylase RimI-like enzyme